MKKKIIRYTLGVAVIVLLATMIIQIRKDNWDLTYVNAIKDIAASRSQHLFTKEQTLKINTYFEKMRENQLSNHKYETFFAEDEDRLYVLVKSDTDEKETVAVCYFVLTFDEGYEVVKSVITSSWIKVGKNTKNF